MTRPGSATPFETRTSPVPLDPRRAASSSTGAPTARRHLANDARQEAALRLKTARGHIDAIIRMLESDEPYCIDVLQQLKAVTGALAKVNASVLRSHVREHVTRPASLQDAEALVDKLMMALRYHHD
ncbi:MAG: metal-sensitive transcriptional regulator [Trueperaceae bacterium]|nr:metal-sensitive transcriptional regulator [Trueperaceae bacterium]